MTKRHPARSLGLGVALVLLLFSHSHAAGRNEVNDWKQFPVDEEHLKFFALPPDKVALFVEAPSPHGVFLGNRTSSAVTFEAQDGDPYLKLEWERTPGVWIRAEPHLFSGCNFSYAQRRLSPGCWTPLAHYMPDYGKKATLRYSIYLQAFELHSNPFQGLMSPTDVELAASDGLAILSASFSRARAIALGKVVLRDEVDGFDLRGLAIRRVGELARALPEARRELETLSRNAALDYARVAKNEIEYLRAGEVGGLFRMGPFLLDLSDGSPVERAPRLPNHR